MKTLIILDLDHTLIYGSYAPSETAKKLFQFNQYLAVYERPFARELVELCKSKGDIIIYTTALKAYAKRISKALKINPVQIMSRKDCVRIGDQYEKHVVTQWIKDYESILIIDDSPNVWRNASDKIIFLVPPEFKGEVNDNNLLEVIKIISTITV